LGPVWGRLWRNGLGADALSSTVHEPIGELQVDRAAVRADVLKELTAHLLHWTTDHLGC
jgi:hypothetical protein